MSMGDPPLTKRVSVAHSLAATKAYIDDMHTDHVIEGIINPKITSMATTITVYDSSSELIGTVTPAELIKYIGERRLIEQNETVRTLWERYQVAVRLVGSESNGQAD